jgi:tripartite-type tricarboxylate transporter receptor subunit TctC
MSIKQPLTGFLLHALASCVLAVAAGNARSESPAEYPTKSVRIVVVYGAGGGLDVVTRLVADPLTRSLGRQVVVENRPGAGGNIGTEHVAKSAPDGYTLMVTTNSHEINAFVYKNPGYDPRKDFTPVVQLTGAPSVLIAHPRSPPQSLKELVSTARAQPGKLVFGTAGNGSPTHIAMELFKSAANIDLVHVPYKTAAQANGDVVAGQIPLAMAALPAVMSNIQGGMLRALAVTTEKRWTGLPDVPTIAESGYPGYSHVTWIGLFVPAGTPAAIVAKLNREITAILANPAVRERLMAMGAEPVGRSAADFDAMLKADYDTTGKLVSRLGLKID